jgi:hypothetical protein
MGEDEPLIVVPELIHLFDKLVRIVAFNDDFDFGCNIKIDEIFNVLPDFLIQLGFLIDSWFGSD